MDIEKAHATSENLTAGDLQIDLRRRTVARAGRFIELRRMEFELLLFLARQSPRFISKNEILNGVWGYKFNPETNIVDVLICRLRAKLDRGFDESCIKTRRGVGYAIACQDN